MVDAERLVRVPSDRGPVWGVVRDGRVFHLADGPFAAELVLGDELGPLDGLPLLAPTVPSKIIGVGRNYADHAAEHGVEVPTEPLLFLKPPSSLLEPGGSIVLPPQSSRVEHEAELAVVIGRRCRNVAPEHSWDHVLGVTCANDVTARDIQRRDPQWTRGKGFDTFTPLGPWIVSGLDTERVATAELVCRVNGEVRQRARAGEMVFSPSELVADISRVMTLEPGDVVLTGTPSGVGSLLPGDVVDVEVVGVGVLSNRVV